MAGVVGSWLLVLATAAAIGAIVIGIVIMVTYRGRSMALRRTAIWNSKRWSEAKACIKDEQQLLYVDNRWAPTLDLMTRRHTQDAFWFTVLRGLSILSGVAITALSGIGISGHTSSTVRWFIFGLGFLVAGSASIEQLGHYGQHRLLEREAREDLLAAGVRLFFGGGNGLPSGFDDFYRAVEQIIQRYNTAYNRTIASSDSDARPSHGQPA
ncbi:MAG: SLATT domain-containing protein [Acidimicrobiales bacterium]|jgi:hypothetical protein